LHLRADDGIRTRDPHLGKVMRYQLRYIRAPRTTRRPSRRTTIVHPSVAAQISTPAAKPRFQAGSEELIRLARNREAVGGPDISARDAGLGALAPQRPGTDRLAVRQYRIRAERGVAGADELGPLAGRDRDPLAVVKLAVRGLWGWRPVAVDYVAPGPVCGDQARDIARRRYESAEPVDLTRGRLGRLRDGPGCRLRRARYGTCGPRVCGFATARGKDKNRSKPGHRRRRRCAIARP
jgi:hypothetical protein